MPVEAALEVTPGIAIKVVDENDVAVRFLKPHQW